VGGGRIERSDRHRYLTKNVVEENRMGEGRTTGRGFHRGTERGGDVVGSRS